MSQTIMTIAELDEFLDREFPQARGDASAPNYAIELVAPLTSRIRWFYSDNNLRPGGTLSGPTMMTLADLALYVAILGSIGPVGLAVTTSLNFNFLARPGQRDLIGECRLLKLGRRLAVGEVAVYSDGSPDMVMHGTGTYSIPPR